MSAKPVPKGWYWVRLGAKIRKGDKFMTMVRPRWIETMDVGHICDYPESYIRKKAARATRRDGAKE